MICVKNKNIRNSFFIWFYFQNYNIIKALQSSFFFLLNYPICTSLLCLSPTALWFFTVIAYIHAFTYIFLNIFCPCEVILFIYLIILYFIIFIIFTILYIYYFILFIILFSYFIYVFTSDLWCWKTNCCAPPRRRLTVPSSTNYLDLVL